ncbi:unnamed protein product [Nesidiocoris tenuis]|uniref:Uncharacterized protein n=1 Tax=Nesidiocoris tenuis TaxID=355587 RepID=A0A6H5FYK1_9HEMI|nr:unnamed protein product [Nesidiocoris tenuis]
MPLPWKLPSDEEARELYRRIDQLITDLYNIVRSILFGPLRQPIPQGGQQEDEPNVPDLLAHLGSNTHLEGDSRNLPPPNKKGNKFYVVCISINNAWVALPFTISRWIWEERCEEILSNITEGARDDISYHPQYKYAIVQWVE